MLQCRIISRASAGQLEKEVNLFYKNNPNIKVVDISMSNKNEYTYIMITYKLII